MRDLFFLVLFSLATLPGVRSPLGAAPPSDRVIGVAEATVAPSLMFHGSAVRGIAELAPRHARTRVTSEAPQVFATPHMDLASIFIVRWDDSWAGAGRFSDAGPFAFYCKDERRFTDADKGGSVYAVPSVGFVSHLERGLGANEWSTATPAPVLAHFDYASALDAMLALGVQVYFVGDADFARIKASPDRGRAVLASLTSENQRRRRNVRPLADAAAPDADRAR